MKDTEGDRRATHYRHFVEAAGSVALSPAVAEGLPARFWRGDGFFVSFVEETLLALSAIDGPDQSDWTAAFRQERLVSATFRVPGASCNLELCGRARAVGRAGDPPGAAGRRTVLITVEAAYFRRRSRSSAAVGGAAGSVAGGPGTPPAKGRRPGSSP